MLEVGVTPPACSKEEGGWPPSHGWRSGLPDRDERAPSQSHPRRDRAFEAQLARQFCLTRDGHPLSHEWEYKGPVLLRGARAPTSKEIRDEGNFDAVGGMRNPFISVSEIPKAASAGRTIRQILDRCLGLHPTFTDSVLASLSGSPLTEPPQELVLSARKGICGLSGRVVNGWSPGLCSLAFSTCFGLSGDPDDCLPDWLNEGAPLGINREVSRRGIFPPVPDQPVDSGYLSKLVLGPTEWTNYRSAEDEPELTCSLLDAMVDKQWAGKFRTWPQVKKALVTEEIVMNRLAPLSKLEPGGSWTHRLVWDLRRSGVNVAILQGERVVLPRILDLVRDVQQIATESTPTFLMGTDVTEAFHQVPLHPSEQAYTVASVAGVFYVFRVLVFG